VTSRGEHAPTGPLVVGLGSPDRGDDAVGAAVARAVGTLGLPGVQVVEHEDPTGLIDLWTGRDVVVVVDAVVSGGVPGALHVLNTSADDAPLTESSWARTGRGGTHAFGIAAAVELARALRRLPGRLVVVGVEAAGFEYDAPLSPPVADAVAGAAAAVVDTLRGAGTPPDPSRPASSGCDGRLGAGTPSDSSGPASSACDGRLGADPPRR
jgi:hydrogenase maturation protease